jgi:hypothetical protein
MRVGRKPLREMTENEPGHALVPRGQTLVEKK